MIDYLIDIGYLILLKYVSRLYVTTYYLYNITRVIKPYKSDWVTH